MESAQSSDPGRTRVIDLSQLPLEELSRLQQQLDAEIQMFQESAADLKVASSKFGRAQSTVDSMEGAEKGKSALVPLSDSVYIKARVVNPDRYLVEIGTGYYVEMSRQKAHDYFQRKYNFVESQIKAILEKVVPEKRQVQSMVVSAMQKRVRETLATQQNGPSPSG